MTSTTPTPSGTVLKRQLINDGYCVIPRVLPPAMLNKMRAATAKLIDNMSGAERQQQVSTGSMIPVTADPVFAELIAWPTALAVLASMGYTRPAFTSGYVISKPPGSPRLFWHYDWAGWDDPNAFDEVPQQVFLMYYLTDTTRSNGCLRVIPGTHTRHHALLDQIEEAHTVGLAEANDLGRPEFGDAHGEVDVPVVAGDLVLGDSRILHASHANSSNQYRTVITLWFHPDMASLSEQAQAFIAAGWCDTSAWPDDAIETVAHFRPAYLGGGAPLPWNRQRPRGR